MKSALLAAALTIGLAAGAKAGTFAETYLGYVDSTVPTTFQALPGAVFPPSVVDNADLFGGGDLQGDFITATFYFDASLGAPNSGTDYNTGSPFSSLDGGFDYDGVTPSPVTYASFDIYTSSGDYSYDYVPDARGSIAVEPGLLVDNTANSLAGDEAYVGLFTPDAPNNVYTNFASLTFPYGTSGSYLAPIATNTGDYDTITFDTFAVEVSPTPELSTWMLMMVGIGGAGLMLRRRSAGVSAA